MFYMFCFRPIKSLAWYKIVVLIGYVDLNRRKR